jgi:LmbE family N-acetylglucosaminyl deacetylase
MEAMSTAVFLHAHPDDESILTGGTMASLAAQGDRVVLVMATRGEHGEVDDGVLAPGETLAERRTAELEAAAHVLGVAEVEWLGYSDSGMLGTATNQLPGSFWGADIEEAAARLAAILVRQRADALVTYDDHGTYGHPDHIQAHRVGIRAAELAATSVVYLATVDRDRVVAQIRDARAKGVNGVPDDSDVASLGVDAGDITTRVDVSAFAEAKRRAMSCHRTQIPADSFFLAGPDDQFVTAFGTEDFIRLLARPGTAETALDLTEAPSPGRSTR